MLFSVYAHMYVCKSGGVYMCIYMNTPSSPFPMQACVYGYVDWDISLVQIGMLIQHHHAVSALRLPAGVHSCWSLTICQGSIEACTVFSFSSMPQFLQEGATVSSMPLGLNRGRLRASVMLQLDVRYKHWDRHTGVASVLINRRGPRSKLWHRTSPLLLNFNLLFVTP